MDKYKRRAREEDKETMKTNWTKADEEFLTKYKEVHKFGLVK